MASFKSSGLSLANKCQLLFGLAVVLILTAALSVPWFRLQRMVDQLELDLTGKYATAWLQHSSGNETNAPEADGFTVTVLTLDAVRSRAATDPFLREVLQTLDQPAKSASSDHSGHAQEFSTIDRSSNSAGTYRYARLLSMDELAGTHRSVSPPAAAADITGPPAPGKSPQEAVNRTSGGSSIEAVLLADHDARSAAREVYINRTYILLSGVFAGILAVAVFYVITTRIILSPVRILRETAERVSQGDLHIRSDISTGDEFEELSETFNSMLANLKQSQDQLRQLNKSLDLQLNELMESNVLLEQANRVKSEFLANVSHELRTPLSSILGFAEVVLELEPAGPDDPIGEKRVRYLSNILSSGRSLLELINDLLDLAKIEAGRLEIYPEPASVQDVCEALMTLIRPQADKKQINLVMNVATGLPTIETDPARFQQIVFNLLSNAVKFTPSGGSVTVSARRTNQRDLGERIEVSVKDTGPGISEEDQQIIFEKFRQVDAGHTRRHSGTGLGLAICKEMSRLLGCDIRVASEIGRGSTFTVLVPLTAPAARPQSLMSAASPSRSTADHVPPTASGVNASRSKVASVSALPYT